MDQLTFQSQGLNYVFYLDNKSYSMKLIPSNQMLKSIRSFENLMEYLRVIGTNLVSFKMEAPLILSSPDDTDQVSVIIKDRKYYVNMSGTNDKITAEIPEAGIKMLLRSIKVHIQLHQLEESTLQQHNLESSEL